MEMYRTGTGQVVRVHERDLCVTGPCVVHNPEPAPGQERWPTHWRHDSEIMERICPHGIGHPAREQFSYWTNSDQWWRSTHGCDGCCREDVGGES